LRAGTRSDAASRSELREYDLKQDTKKLTVGILAHVDAGKTTLSEAMLYRAGAIRKPGRVDRGDSFLDTGEIERSRGITIFSKQAVLDWDGIEITILDTPGHVDFSAEMERTLGVIDCALLIISASDGVQSHTETVWKLLRRRGIPVFIFVNKMDLAVRSRQEIADELRKKLDSGIVDLTELCGSGRGDGRVSDESLVDEITLADPELAEPYLEHGYITDREIAGSAAARRIFPCCFGSALKGEGDEGILWCLTRFSPPSAGDADAGGALRGKVFKVMRGRNGERLVFMKILSGTLNVRDTVRGDGWEDKAGQIRIYSGEKHRTVQSASAGTVCAVTGLSEAMPGDIIGEEAGGRADEEVLEPFISYVVTAEDGTDPHELLSCMEILGEEDPKLHVEWDADTREVRVRLMGQVQEEVLTSIIESRFGIAVSFGTGRIMYRETIEDTVEGVGHFEPLRHYAEVHLIMEPGERGSGLVFDSDVSTDDLAINWQRLILTHLGEKEHRGVLTGSPITDMKITLAAGRAHPKHTEGGDFRQATYRAVRNGLMKAKSILLEPWFSFRIELPSSCVGRAMTDIQKGGGSFGEPLTDGDTTVIEGRAPAAVLLDYRLELTKYTSGKGRLSCRLDGFDVCHNAEEVIAASGYDPERDTAEPADSVFTSHGSSEIVKWDEVEKRMHIPSVLKEREGGDDDARSRAMRYGRKLATDRELMEIFEKTYGKINRDPRRNMPKVVRQDGNDPGAAERERRNAEIRAKHSRRLDQSARDEQYIVIDGYNLINASKELKELASADFGAAREQLLGRLCNYRGYMECRMTVVFDAYKVPYGDGSVTDFHGVEVVFTKMNETADSYISTLTKSLPKGMPVKVVTSDQAVQEMSLGHGAVRMSSREFLAEVSAVEEEIRDILYT
jgi:ribosomal protection tetracycline resistance protein